MLPRPAYTWLLQHGVEFERGKKRTPPVDLRPRCSQAYSANLLGPTCNALGSRALPVPRNSCCPPAELHQAPGSTGGRDVRGGWPGPPEADRQQWWPGPPAWYSPPESGIQKPRNVRPSLRQSRIAVRPATPPRPNSALRKQRFPISARPPTSLFSLRSKMLRLETAKATMAVLLMGLIV